MVWPEKEIKEIYCVPKDKGEDNNRPAERMTGNVVIERIFSSEIAYDILYA